MKKTVCLILILLLTVPTGVLAVWSDSTVIVQNVSFFSMNGEEIYASSDSDVYAQVTVAAKESTEIMVVLAAYSGNSASDVELKKAAAGDTVVITTESVALTSSGSLKLFVWGENLRPFCRTLAPSLPEDIPLEGLEVSLTKNSTVYTYKGDINPQNRTVTLDIPSSCTTLATAAAVYADSDIESVTPLLTLAQGWSCEDGGSKNLNEEFTYTFTKDGEAPVTYTVKTNRTDLGRFSSFETGSQVTSDATDSGALNAFKAAPTIEGSRQLTHWSGHQGGGLWRQKGYLEVQTTDTDGNEVWAVDEDNTYGDIILAKNINGNTSKAYQLDKTKTGSVLEMTNYQANSNGADTTLGYRLYSDICLGSVTGGAYLLASSNGGAGFVKNGDKYDLYYRDTDGEKIFLKSGVIDDAAWHSIAISAVTEGADTGEYETMSFYIDGILTAQYIHKITSLTPVSAFNIRIGIEADSTGSIAFDNWCATDIELSMAENPVVWLIGDSLVQDYSDTSITQGWGTYLPGHLDGMNVITSNQSVAGSVSDDYLTSDGKYASRWTTVKNNIKPGDVLIITLGYNETDLDVYAENLKSFSEFAHQNGAEPVFITMPVQLSLDGTTYQNRRQDRIDKMNETVSVLGDTLLDLNSKMLAYYGEICGPLNSDGTLAGGDINVLKALYEGTDGIADNHPTGDWLHFRESGARLIAQFVAELTEESNSTLKELLKGGYIGILNSFTLDGKYDAEINGYNMTVSILGEIGGAMLDSSVKSLSDMSFAYTSEDGNLVKKSDTEYVFTGENGRTKTYTVIPKYYTAISDMDFDSAVINSDGTIYNAPATNSKGASNGGTAAVWHKAGSAGTNTIENGKLRLEKTATGAQHGILLKNSEYAADTDRINVKFSLNVAELGVAAANQFRIQVGENIPYFRINNASTADGTYTLSFYSGQTEKQIAAADVPVLSAGTQYDFEITFEKDSSRNVTMILKVDGKTVTVSEQLEIHEQMALMPQFALVGYYAGLFTAYLDNVHVSYAENTLENTDNVFLVGDSICYTYPESRTSNSKTIQGWGKILQNRIDSGKYTVVNTAREGQSTAIYLNGGIKGSSYDHRFDLAEAWSFITKRINDGDYVIIGLAWNDSGYVTIDGYKANLTAMATEVKAKGAVPILVTPTVACNMTSYAVTNSKSSWADAMKSVAESEDILCLDLNSKIYDIMSGKTDAEKESCYTDGTHYTEAGALLVGNTICDLINESDCALKDALLEEEKEPVDTLSTLVTFEDMAAGTAEADFDDSRFTVSRNASFTKAGDITIANDPSSAGTHGKVMKIVTYAGSNNNDTVAFKMASGSGKSEITAQYDIYIAENNTTSQYASGSTYYNYIFHASLNSLQNVPIGVKRIKNSDGTFTTDANASINLRADTSSTPPASVIAENAIELGRWYTIKYVYDTSDGTCDFYVDGVLVSENNPNYLNSHNGASHKTSTSGINFVALNQGAGTYYIDNISVTAE